MGSNSAIERKLKSEQLSHLKKRFLERYKKILEQHRLTNDSSPRFVVICLKKYFQIITTYRQIASYCIQYICEACLVGKYRSALTTEMSMMDDEYPSHLPQFMRMMFRMVNGPFLYGQLTKGIRNHSLQKQKHQNTYEFSTFLCVLRQHEDWLLEQVHTFLFLKFYT